MSKGTIKNWFKYRQSRNVSPGNWVIRGFLYGSKEYPDGIDIQTSPVITWGRDPEGRWIKTYSGSVYRLANEHGED